MIADSEVPCNCAYLVGVRASQADQPQAFMGHAGVEHVGPPNFLSLGPGENLEDVSPTHFELVTATHTVVEVDAVTRLIHLPRLVTRVNTVHIHVTMMTGAGQPRPGERSCSGHRFMADAHVPRFVRSDRYQLAQGVTRRRLAVDESGP